MLITLIKMNRNTAIQWWMVVTTPVLDSKVGKIVIATICLASIMSKQDIWLQGSLVIFFIIMNLLKSNCRSFFPVKPKEKMFMKKKFRFKAFFFFFLFVWGAKARVL